MPLVVNIGTQEFTNNATIKGQLPLTYHWNKSVVRLMNDASVHVL